MLRAALHPLFLFPVLLLVGFIGLFSVAEQRRVENDAALRIVFSDPEPALSLDLQSALLSTLAEINALADTPGSPEQLEAIRKNTQAIRATAHLLQDHFGQEEKLRNRAPETSGLLGAILRNLDFLEEALPTTLPFDDATFIEISKRMTVLATSFETFHRTASKIHKEEMAALLQDSNEAEHQRLLLFLSVLGTGFVLVLFLLYNASTYRRTAEKAQATERYNALFAAALQSTRVGVLIRDMRKPERPVVFLNNAFTRMTGYSFDDAIDRSSEFLFGWHTDPATASGFRQAIRDHMAETFTILVYRKDGSPFWSEWHVSPVFDKTGILTHFVSLLGDVTNLRQTQEALTLAKEQAEHASAVKTNFLAVMSHEIRTPINGLLGVLSLMEDSRMDPEQRRLVGIAVTSGKALHEIINDILDYAKMEAGKTSLVCEPFFLRDLSQSVIDLMHPVATEKNIGLEVEIDERVPDVFNSDAGKLRQVLLNLVSNAIKFTDEGKVSVHMRHLMTQEQDGQNVAMIRFEVIDSGIGISLADQDKLFKEFSQIERSFKRRFGGTGLGLAITRRLVKLLGGEIGVESKPGHGSKFWFILPLPLAAEEDVLDGRVEEAVLLEERPLAQGQHKILLVEDNETNRIVASRYLQKASYAADCATTGAQAIEMAQVKAYDLILMDVSMPEMDGMEATGRIRALGGPAAKVPIIALTAHVMQGDRERCLAAGMNDYLNKPLTYEALVAALEKWLRVRIVTAPPASAQVALQAQTQEQEAPQAVPLFDRAILLQLCEDLGQEAVARITEVFLTDSAHRVELLKNLCVPSDFGDIQLAAHTLKSSAASCGLASFAEQMKKLETAAREKNVQEAEVLLAAVPALYASASAALTEERKAYLPEGS